MTGHPAILTFQPMAVSQTLTGSWQEGGRAVQVTVSPFSLSVEASGGTPYRKIGELRADTALVFPGRHHPAGVGAGHRPYRQHQHLPG